MVVVSKKIPGGKLVKISFTTEKNTLSTFKLYGDFFLHPETTIDLIEQQLIGVDIGDVASTIQLILDEHDAELIGVSPSDIQSIMQEHKDTYDGEAHNEI